MVLKATALPTEPKPLPNSSDSCLKCDQMLKYKVAQCFFQKLPESVHSKFYLSCKKN